jgi:hypothetical protein
MTRHRHSTDRQETVVIGGCPEGCQEFELESTGDPAAVQTLVESCKSAYGTCSQCGSEIGFLRKDEPKEVLD